MEISKRTTAFHSKSLFCFLSFANKSKTVATKSAKRNCVNYNRLKYLLSLIYESDRFSWLKISNFIT